MRTFSSSSSFFNGRRSAHGERVAWRCLASIALSFLLGACATNLPIERASPVAASVKATSVATKTPPPGYELFETLLCYRSVRQADLPGLSPTTKPFAIPVSMFIPKKRCTTLRLDGVLEVVEGSDCGPATPPLPKVMSCE